MRQAQKKSWTSSLTIGLDLDKNKPSLYSFMFVCLKTSQVRTLVLGLFNKQVKPKHKKFKPISALPHSVGLKSCLISTLSPLRGRENLRRPKWGEAKQNCRPYLHMRPTFYLFIYLFMRRKCSIPDMRNNSTIF